MSKWQHNLLLLATLLLPTSSSQVPFRYPLNHDLFSPEQGYKLEWPVKRVAVIGAGVGYVQLLSPSPPPLSFQQRFYTYYGT